MNPVKKFRELRPDLKIYDKIVDGEDTINVTVLKRHGKGAGKEMWNCQGACAIVDSTPAVAALVQLSVTHLLVPNGKGYYVKKYNHNGRDVVEANDKFDFCVSHVQVKLRPPSGAHKVGMNQDPPGRVRRKQSPEHIAARLNTKKKALAWYSR